MVRFEDVPVEVTAMVDKVIAKWFPELARARIKVVFDIKKRKSKGMYVFGRMQKCSEIMRFLSQRETNSEEGFDYILYLDKGVWDHIQEADQVRLVRHEMRHCFYDLEAKADPYKLVGHDVEDFMIEMDLNQDDPRWRNRLAAVAESVYDRED